jgi:hypothetical protein
MATTAEAALDRLWRRFRAADGGGPDRGAPVGNADLDTCYLWAERAAIIVTDGGSTQPEAEREATIQVAIKPDAASMNALNAAFQFPVFPAGTTRPE